MAEAKQRLKRQSCDVTRYRTFCGMMVGMYRYDIIRYIHLGRAVQHKPVHGLSCIRTGALQGPPFFEPLDLLDLLDLGAHSFLPTLNHVLFGTPFEILPDSIRQGTPRFAKHHMNEIPIWGWIMDQVTYEIPNSLEEAEIQPFEGEPLDFQARAVSCDHRPFRCSTECLPHGEEHEGCVGAPLQ